MNNEIPVDLTPNNRSSFKYKSSHLPAANINGVFENMKIAVSLKYISNFWRSLEMPSINCKIYLDLSWSKDDILSTRDDTTSKMTKTKLYVPTVTLSSKDNAKLIKILEEGFKRPVYWNEYQTNM